MAEGTSCRRADRDANRQANLSRNSFGFDNFPPLETHMAAVFFEADDTMDLVGGK